MRKKYGFSYDSSEKSFHEFVNLGYGNSLIFLQVNISYKWLFMKKWMRLWSQKYYKGKKQFEPFFQLLKINDLGKFEKSQQVYLSEKEGEAIPAFSKTIDHDAVNIGLVSNYETNLAKNQLWTRSATSLIEYMK